MARTMKRSLEEDQTDEAEEKSNRRDAAIRIHEEVSNDAAHSAHSLFQGQQELRDYYDNLLPQLPTEVMPREDVPRESHSILPTATYPYRGVDKDGNTVIRNGETYAFGGGIYRLDAIDTNLEDLSHLGPQNTPENLRLLRAWAKLRSSEAQTLADADTYRLHRNDDNIKDERLDTHGKHVQKVTLKKIDHKRGRSAFAKNKIASEVEAKIDKAVPARATIPVVQRLMARCEIEVQERNETFSGRAREHLPTLVKWVYRYLADHQDVQAFIEAEIRLSMPTIAGLQENPARLTTLRDRFAAENVLEKVIGMDLVLVVDKHNALVASIVSGAIQLLCGEEAFQKYNEQLDQWHWMCPGMKVDHRHENHERIFIPTHPSFDLRNATINFQPRPCSVSHWGPRFTTGNVGGPYLQEWFPKSLKFDIEGKKTHALSQWDSICRGAWDMDAKVSALLLETFSPEDYQEMRATYENIPEDLRAVTGFDGNCFPFNAQLAGCHTEGHCDTGDRKAGLTATQTGGNYTGGELMLSDIGMMLDLLPGSHTFQRSQSLWHPTDVWDCQPGDTRYCHVQTQKDQMHKLYRPGGTGYLGQTVGKKVFEPVPTNEMRAAVSAKDDAANQIAEDVAKGEAKAG